MSKKQEKERTQNLCRWIDPSDDSLPPQVSTGNWNAINQSPRAHNPFPKREEPPMSGMLTVPEKEYWNGRIEKQIERRMEAIVAEDPSLLDCIGRQSRERALASLGLLDWQKEWDADEQQRITLERRKRQIERSMLAQVRGVPVEDIDDYENHRHHREVQQAVERRQAVYQDELLGESEIGQHILKLRKEKETLLDAVWLATSLKQIWELWSKLTELLNDEATPLERETLAIVTREN